MKKQFQKRKLVACLELHTFSSLNKKFMKEYNGCMNKSDTAIVYFNPKSIINKGLEDISQEQVCNAFNHKDLLVFRDSKKLEIYLKSLKWKDRNLLMMSSGNFNEIEINKIY